MSGINGLVLPSAYIYQHHHHSVLQGEFDSDTSPPSTRNCICPGLPTEDRSFSRT